MMGMQGFSRKREMSSARTAVSTREGMVTISLCGPGFDDPSRIIWGEGGIEHSRFRRDGD